MQPYGMAPSIKLGVLGGALALGLSVAAFAQNVKLDVIYVPTPFEVVERMLNMAEVKKGEFLIDLGSGDGRIPVTAAKKFGARGFGVDINPERVREANENAKKEGVADQVEFRVQNLYETDFSKADVLSMYLLTEINLKLRPRILSELRPGARVVSHAFEMGDWKPDQQDKLGTRDVYLWIVPAKLQGRWQVEDGETSFALNIEQNYQEFTGNAVVNGQTAPIRNPQLRGDQVRFTLDIAGRQREYLGTVKGNAIEATGQGTPWKARRSG